MRLRCVSGRMGRASGAYWNGGDMSKSGPARHWLERVDVALTICVAAIIFTVMTVTAIDVVGRYFFSAPLRVAYEVTQIGMALIIFASLPQVTARYEHVATALFVERQAEWLRKLRHISSSIIACTACAIFSWRLWVQALDDFNIGLAMPVSKIPEYPLSFAMAGFAAVTTVILLLQCFKTSQQAPKEPLL